MEKVVIIYTNWRRRNNLTEIISKCKNQTLLPKIIVVDNASSDENERYITDDPSIEIIKKDNTLMCWERWLVSFNYDSDYLCIMDDDISFNRDNIIEECYNYMEKTPNIDCIGYEGVVLNKSREYFNSGHYIASLKDIMVSIVKGRFMFIRKSSLNGLDLGEDLTCDDIKVSSYLKNKKLPLLLYNGFYDLQQGNESLSGKSYQRIKRDYSTRRYFK